MRSLLWISMLPVMLAALCLSATPAKDPGRHPVDGPDVDLRILIKDSEVRFEIIMNLAYVDEIVESEREDEYALHEVEEPAVHESVLEFYKKSNKVKIDGVLVAPLDKGFEVDPGDPKWLPLFTRMKEKALIRVQLSLSYPTKAPPKKMSLVWGRFPPNTLLTTEDGTPAIEINAHLIAKGVDKIVPLTEFEPEFTWHDTGERVEDRFLAVPEPPKASVWDLPLWSIGLLAMSLLSVFSLLVFGAPSARVVWVVAPLMLLSAFFLRGVGAGVTLPGETDARQIFQPLHRNIYRAFDYVEKGQIYDALKQSVEGPLLDQLYNQVYRSLIMHEEGGAVSRVEGVKTLDVKVENIGVLPSHGNRPGFQAEARWQVRGVVRHWNHAHFRTNEYRARYTVVQADAGWRIADHEVLEQRRVDDQNKPIEDGK